MTKYFVYDVFTDSRFGGNPLAIIPDASGLPEGDFQRIAREFNFSETTFVLPPDDPSHTAKIRIFSPLSELPFAGHPTIGTAIALARQGHGPDMTLELGVGPIVCHATDHSARFSTQVPLKVLAEPEVADVAQVLGLTVADIVLQTHPPTTATLGIQFTITEVRDRATLSAAKPNIEALRRFATKYPQAGRFAQHVYTRSDGVIFARMFDPLDNIPEDAATGSAAATLGALLVKCTSAPQEFIIRQGDDMGRPSRIEVDAKAEEVTIAGSAVAVMEGQLL
jgi:trans-2,3-dihydro-3-hydroxyanthranilate isomerase